MKLTETNQAWLEKAAEELGTEGETLLNAIVRQLRERAGDRTGGLEDWLKSAGTAQVATEGEREEWQRSRIVGEEAARAGRMCPVSR